MDSVNSLNVIQPSKDLTATSSVATVKKETADQSKKTVKWNGHLVSKAGREECCTLITGFCLALTLILLIAGAGSRNLKCVHAAVAFGIFAGISYTIEKVMQYKRHNFNISING